MSAHVVMLASGRGGAGKTTVTALLGAALAARGKNVLAVELSPGLRSLDAAAGVTAQTVYDLGDVLEGRCPVEKAVTASPLYAGLYVLCAPFSEARLPAAQCTVLIDRLRPLFDFILLDTASGMGAAFAAASAAANAALLVITPDAMAVRSGRIVADALHAAGHVPARMVLNKVPDSLEGTGLDDLDACIDGVCTQLIGVLPLSRQIQRAACTGSPLEVQSPVHAAFAALAARMCGWEVPLIFT